MDIELSQYRESHLRSLLKAFSWRVVATTTTAIIAFIITGEVEAALLSHDQVEEGAVYPVPDEEGSQRIEAAVIAKKEANLAAADLTRYLTDRLSWYAIPGKIIFVEKFPRTASDKINRRELQARALQV